uniref:Amidohydrolase 3 domain-containing protein n=1 Tax=Bionectria ochroleuca TaxID=29856 RepID=A0A8H7NG38_BIOOC
MAGSLLRWTLWSLTAAIVAAFAVAYRLQQPLVGTQPSSATTPSSAGDTYCYQGITTLDDDRPDARCFSVADGSFSHVLTDEQVAELEPAHVHASPGYVIPGLWDGHGHLLQYGEFLHSVDLFGCESLEDVRTRVKEYLNANPDAGSKDHWLRGVGWDQTAFGRMPTAADVEQDPLLKGKYLMLDRIDVHCVWVSQSVLDLLPSDLPEIPGGEIVRDPGMGVFCDNAMDYITKLWPKPSDEFKARTVKTAMAKLNQVGLVGMHDAGATPSTHRLYQKLAKTDDWTVRVYGMLECDKRNSFCPDEAAQIHDPDFKFTVRSVKLFGDGALGSWGSAMLEPYTDHPWTSGSLLINASALTQVAKSWAAAGYQVNIHAIGDLANRNAVDALEAALEQECPEHADHLARCQSLRRFRIEHAQIIHPDDQDRILALGIIPSIQPTHATSDFKYAQDRLGLDRLLSSAYRMRSLLPARPSLGSDFPVEPPNPFEGIYAAVTRRNPHTGKGPSAADPDLGFLPDEILSLRETLLGFTRSPAYAAFLEAKAGVIREGAFADWVVLDEPLDRLSFEDLRTLKVKETWVAGRRVYSRDDTNLP